MVRSSTLRSTKSQAATALRPLLEQMERRQLLSFADGNGPVVTAVTELPGISALVITFDGPLNPTAARKRCQLSGHEGPGEPRACHQQRGAVRIISASYSDTTASQVTLTLKNSLKPGLFYRIFINGTPASMSVNPASNPLTDINGVLFDGDNDDTPGGDFYGLFALGNEGCVHRLERRACLAGREGRWCGQCLARARWRHRSIERGRRRRGD